MLNWIYCTTRVGSYGRPAGYSGSSGGGTRKNELGFYGDTRPNPRLEQELFHSNDSQTTGINFDKVIRYLFSYHPSINRNSNNFYLFLFFRSFIKLQIPKDSLFVHY